jgi:hypothetical protein
MTRNDQKREPRLPRSPLHVEIDRTSGGIAVLVAGVRAIRELTDTTALLRLKGGYLRISGVDVTVTVYENRTVEVLGGVGRIEIENDKA